VKLALAVALLAACGDNAHGVDAGVTCAATFAGNFADTTSSQQTCAQLTKASGSDDVLLGFAIDSGVLGAQATISIDLGIAPATGAYSSETLATWHAVEARSIEDGACVYSAGSVVVPTGSFQLQLGDLDAAGAHGSLSVVQYVHAVDSANCGPFDTEMIDVAF
jgi:hypothetical protein